MEEINETPTPAAVRKAKTRSIIYMTYTLPNVLVMVIYTLIVCGFARLTGRPFDVFLFMDELKVKVTFMCKIKLDYFFSTLVWALVALKALRLI